MRDNVFSRWADSVEFGHRGRLPLSDAAAGDVTAGGVTATIGEILFGYAERGFLVGVSAPVLTHSGAEYGIVWHDHRLLKFMLDSKRGTLAIPQLLPNIAAESPMYKDLRRFIRAFGSPKKPVHRRIDPDKGAISCRNRNGAVAVVISVRDADFAYATRRLFNVVHEIFMVFLPDGPYFDYDIAQLGKAE